MMKKKPSRARQHFASKTLDRKDLVRVAGGDDPPPPEETNLTWGGEFVHGAPWGGK